MSEDLLSDIQSLIDAPPEPDQEPFLARIEDRLTDGYAAALALEAERWRLERKIGEIATALAEGDAALKTEELAGLAKRMSAADGDLTRLRGLLGALRERASDLRSAAV
jgi:hypothetical protein